MVLTLASASFLTQIKYSDPGGRVWITNPEAVEDPTDPVTVLSLHHTKVVLIVLLLRWQNPYMPPPFGWASKDKCTALLATGAEV